MIIRRKMPRLLSRRPIGVTGLRSLQQSSAHVRRMVVSQLPASFSNASSTGPRSDQATDYAPFDTPLAPPNSEPKSRMPKDLQAIFDMHKALGHVQTPKKSLIERIAEQRASEPQPPPPPSARIQKRPDNVRYEPDSRVQRSLTPTFTEPDIEPLPEMLPPKSNRVRSFVEYVNVSSGVPESHQSSETGDGNNSETESDSGSSSTSDDTDWASEDDLPDAMPGSFTFDTTVESTSASHTPLNTPIQRYVDDEHPTLVDTPLETFQSSPDSNSETIQRHFDPIEASDEDLLPPSRRDSFQTDSGTDTTSATNEEDLPASVNVDDSSVDSRTDAGNLPIQRSFAAPETSEEELSPPRRYDAPQKVAEEAQDADSDDYDEIYTDTVIDSGSDPVSNLPIQRSFAAPETSEEELSPPRRYDAPQDEYSDDYDEIYTNMVIDNGSDSVSNPPIQRTSMPVESDSEDLLPPTSQNNIPVEGDHNNFVAGNLSPSRNDITRKSPPIQRNFEQFEASGEDLLPPVSYSGDTHQKPSAPPIQRSVDDEWEETSSLTDTEAPSFENPVIASHEFDTVESGEELLPPSYQRSDRSKRETVNTEKTTADHNQPRRMTVSSPDSPIVQRFGSSDNERISDNADTISGNYDLDDETAASGLGYQALDLGQALLNAGIAKTRPESEAQPPPSNSFPVLMPPIGRAHHSTSASTGVMQRVPVQPSIQRTETPAPIQPAPSSVDVSLLDALGMPPDTVIQRSGPQLPTTSESPPVEVESPIAIQRVDDNEGGNNSETLQNESGSSPNVEEMAKQVYRILQRRFRIERERSKGR